MATINADTITANAEKLRDTLTENAEKLNDALTENAEKLTASINARLDQLEEALPPVPAKVLHLQRAVATAYYERTTELWMAVSTQTKDFAEAVRSGATTVTDQARTAVADFAKLAQERSAQVVDQARSAATDVAKSAQSSARQFGDQATAQSRKVAEKAESSTTKLLDDAINAVDDDAKPSTANKPYAQWTKAELLERAKELDIEGRTTMSKSQLINALRK
ncbi:MAG: Rho termination factor N-terminal domain-containing protein [Desertimonas sp.]